MSVINRRDLDFVLHEWLKVEQLFERPVFSEHSRETVDALLDLSERLAEDSYLPLFKECDRSDTLGVPTADG